LTKIGKSDICQECFKFSEDIETSEEAFKEIVEGALPKNYVESYKRIIQNMVKHISNNLASEIIAQKISKEMHIEYVKGTNKLVVNHWKI
jgi:mannitol/fructose-specific phosphotransferase system IIA component (Ntr-type)